MSEQKVVFNKLFKKEELASHKVELGLIDDIEKLQIEANNSEDSAVAEVSKSLATLKNAVKLFDKAILSSKNVTQQIDKAKILAKDLGVDLPQNIDSKYKYYENSIKSFNEIKKSILDFDSKVNSI
jgi:hypothetical protein